MLPKGPGDVSPRAGAIRNQNVGSEWVSERGGTGQARWRRGTRSSVGTPGLDRSSRQESTAPKPGFQDNGEKREPRADSAKGPRRQGGSVGLHGRVVAGPFQASDSGSETRNISGGSGLGKPPGVSQMVAVRPAARGDSSADRRRLGAAASLAVPSPRRSCRLSPRSRYREQQILHLLRVSSFQRKSLVLTVFSCSNSPFSWRGLAADSLPPAASPDTY